MSPILVASVVFGGLMIAASRARASGPGPTPNGGGMSFVPKKKRDVRILDDLAAGRFVLTNFTTVVGEYDGHEVEVRACNDALRVGHGSLPPREMVSHELAQAIADSLELFLPTSRMSDMAWLATPEHEKLGPITLPTGGMMTDAARDLASEKIDQAMAVRGVEQGAFVRCVGKEWITSERLLEEPGASTAGCVITAEGWAVANIRGQGGVRLAGTVAGCNFGWQWEPGASKTPGGLPCIQSVGRRHGPDHYDYAQMLTLYDRVCRIDGQEFAIEDVLRDPDLAYLLSDEVAKGTACRVTRHPAFPLLVG